MLLIRGHNCMHHTLTDSAYYAPYTQYLNTRYPSIPPHLDPQVYESKTRHDPGQIGLACVEHIYIKQIKLVNTWQKQQQLHND